jgi:large subunit ribosomal protein L4e
VQLHGVDGVATVPLPDVLTAPIRLDVVNFVHTNMNKNARQAVARSRFAGEQTSAESWGTGRAVSRIPRVSGSGTHRSGQGAFGNMCCKGRAFAPLKRWRRWHRHVNKDQRRFAVCSALAASAVAPLVMSRGHKVMQIPEVPLVVADSAIANITKTSEAVKLLEKIGAAEDVARVKASRNIRAGRGAMRNRRYTQRTGPLLIHDGKGNKRSTIAHAFRNISGVTCASVHSLNLLELAPGGHLGRFIIWTESAFKALDSVYGTNDKVSEAKHAYNPPTTQVTNADIGSIINSTDVQSALRAKKKGSVKHGRKVNALKNMHAMAKLNPYFITVRRRAVLAGKASKEDRAKKIAKARKGSQSPKYVEMLHAE